MSYFQHLICVLCSIVNEIWVYEICKINAFCFYLHLFTFYTASQLFWIWGCLIQHYGCSSLCELVPLYVVFLQVGEEKDQNYQLMQTFFLPLFLNYTRSVNCYYFGLLENKNRKTQHLNL